MRILGLSILMMGRINIVLQFIIIHERLGKT
jgi:hypothetical protein